MLCLPDFLGVLSGAVFSCVRIIVASCSSGPEWRTLKKSVTVGLIKSNEFLRYVFGSCDLRLDGFHKFLFIHGRRTCLFAKGGGFFD